MKAGELRHQITIQQATKSQDSTGASSKSWTTFATVWAAIDPIRGREYFDADKVNAEVTHRIRLRYYPGITPKMQVVFGSRTFRIESVLNLEERNREVHLMTVEVV